MNAGFWAGDAIAQSMERAVDKARADATLKKQQGFHCGAQAVGNSALAALAALDPEHPLLNSRVREEIWEQGNSTFHRHGWDAAWALTIDATALHERLKAEFEVERREALRKVEKEPIKADTRGFFTTRNVWVFDGEDFLSEADALAAKEVEIARLTRVELGDTLEFSVMEKKERARVREAAAKKARDAAELVALPPKRHRMRAS